MSIARRLLWPATLALAVGCSQHPAPAGGSPTSSASSAPSSGTPVARFDGESVSAEEIQAALAAIPPSQRARYATPEARKKYVEDVARFRILVHEAQKEGLANDPDVVAAANRLMVHKLLSHALTQMPPPADSEIAAYFQAHQAEFQRPETVRAAEISINATDAASRKKAHATANTLVQKIRALKPTDAAGFAELARHYSQDPRTRMFGGDLRYATREMLARELGPKAAEAAFKLQKPGETVVVDTDRAVLVLRLVNHTASFQPKLEEARPQIVARLSSQRRSTQLFSFVQKLQTEAGLTVDDAALAKITVDPKAPVKPLGHPMPETFAAPTPPPGSAK